MDALYKSKTPTMEYLNLPKSEANNDITDYCNFIFNTFKRFNVFNRKIFIHTI